MQTPFRQQVSRLVLLRQRLWAVLCLARAIVPRRTRRTSVSSAGKLLFWAWLYGVIGPNVGIVEGQTYDPIRSAPANAPSQLDALLGINQQDPARSRSATTGQFVAIPTSPALVESEKLHSREDGNSARLLASSWQPQAIADRTALQSQSANVAANSAVVPPGSSETGNPNLHAPHPVDQPLSVKPVDYRAENRSSDPLDQPLPGPTQRGDGQESMGEGVASSFGQGANQLMQTGVALTVVLGLMLGFFWVFRRTAPKSLLPLPLETVQVLGNAPLHGKQHLRLIRLGHRVLLLAVSENTSQTLAEVTDPDEVRYLLELCEARVSRGESQTFAEILQQSGRERTTGFLGSQQDQVRQSHGSKTPRDATNRTKPESATRSAVRPVSNHFFEA